MNCPCSGSNQATPTQSGQILMVSSSDAINVGTTGTVELDAKRLVLTADPAGAKLLDALRAKAAAIPDVRAYLHERLRQAWEDRWIKSLPKKRHLPPRKHKRGTGGHFSIHRVLLETKKTKDV